MTVSQPVDHAGGSWKWMETRAWRRRLIVAMYASYAALVAEVLVHEHIGRPWPSGLRIPAELLFWLTAAVITVSWVWMLSAAVRYGFGPSKRRTITAARLRELKAQGYTAKEVMATMVSPPDERQQAVRHRAQAVAFQISAVIVIGGAIYAVLAIQVLPGLWLPHSSAEIWAIVTALVLLYSTLPPAILAWTEPDPAVADH
jgi:hypothetical protein